MQYNLKGKIVMGGSLPLDKTLTVEGAAADAKATGDAVRNATADATAAAQAAQKAAEEAKKAAQDAAGNNSEGSGGGSISGGTATADLDMDGYKILNLPTPENPGDAVNKDYADKIAEKIERFTNTDVDDNGDESNNLSGGGDTIVNVGTPENDTDAANKEYVDTVIKEVVTEKVIYVETKTDGTEVEHVSGGGTTIVQVATPVENTDAANKEYVDTKVAKSGDTMSGILNMGGNRITDVATPTSSADAVNKAYADAVGVCRDTLFVNTDTATEYAAQTIAVSNLSDYDDVHLELATDCGDTYGVFYYTELVKEAVGKQIVIYKTLVYGETVAQVFRTFTFTSSGITVGDCYAYNTDGNITKENLCLIPTKIEGIKYGGAGTTSLPAAEEMMFG